MAMVTFVGLDVHLHFIVAVWRKIGGSEQRAVVETTPEGLQKLIQIIGQDPAWAAYEASGCGWEIYDRLTRLGWKVSVLAPTHLVQTTRTRKTKTDLRDARRILDVLMAHGALGTGLPAVWVPDRKTREDRELVRRRLKLAEKLAAVKAEILSTLRIQQVRKPETLKASWSAKHRAWLKGLCGMDSGLGNSVRSALESQLRELHFILEELSRLEMAIETLAQEEAYQHRVKKMRERKGVGTLTAITVLVELGDPHRFPNRRKLSSYLGLVPTSYDSGGTERRGHLTRMGPARVRKLLNQAAWIALRHDPELARWFGQLSARRGPKRAIVAVMRRLGIELWQKARAA